MRTWFKIQSTIWRLGGSDPTARLEAARQLGEQRIARAVPSLITALDDPEVRVAIAASDALAQIGDASAVEELITRLKTAPPTLATSIIRALSSCSLGKAARQLAELALHGDPETSEFARKYLWQLGPPAVDALRSGLSHASADVRKRACVLLDELKAPLETAEQRLTAAMARERYDEAVAQGEAGLAAILELIRSRPDLGKKVGEMLARAGAITPLVAIFRSFHLGRPRQEILDAIALVRHHEAIPVLASTAAAGDDYYLRDAALSALAMIGEPAVPALGNLLHTEDAALQEAVAVRLSRVADGRRLADSPQLDSPAREKLSAINLRRWVAVGHHHAWVKERGGQWNHIDWVTLITKLGVSDFWPMNEAALGQTLEGAKCTYSADLVAELASSVELEQELARRTAGIEDLRHRAANRLTEHARMAARYESMPDSAERDRLRSDMWTVLRLDDDLRSLQQALESLMRVRLRLEELERRCRHPLAVTPLIGLLSHRVHEVRIRAIRLLGRIGDPRAVGPLREMASSGDPACRPITLESLQMLGAS